ncbi:aspartyl protease [Talaromyces pinophilus]|uniref:Aspartyl protease n=1 Tax=Talaromyces pinophilus TaxID=128442 RepID=A0A6V8H1H8_TALPI|nr:aspartyl protease [Talaromyces pinophilus]
MLCRLASFIPIVNGAAVTNATTFQVFQQKNPNFVKNASAIHYADLARYNTTLNSTYGVAAVATVAAGSAWTLGQAGTTPAIGVLLESEYVCPVTIGGQTLFLDFDTGSSDLWVFSTLTAGLKFGHQLYDPALSPTARLVPGTTWEITYADGSGSGGVVYKDVVSIGTVVSPNQGVEPAVFVSPQFAFNPFSSGLLGLAFSFLNTASPEKQLTFFENVLPTLKEPLFTANLKHGEPGNYNFGYIDPTEYTGVIGWAPVTFPYGYPAYWQLDFTGFQVGATPYVERLINGIADTGTTLLYLPPDVVIGYYAQVAGAFFDLEQAAWIFPCTSILPDFVFGIGAYRGVVPGEYINFEPLGDGTCYGGIQISEELGFSIFGDILLKAQFVIFDHAGPRVGFANKL